MKIVSGLQCDTEKYKTVCSYHGYECHIMLHMMVWAILGGR